MAEYDEFSFIDEQLQEEQEQEVLIPEPEPVEYEGTDYTQLPEEELQKDKLLRNEDFLTDAEIFLRNRTGSAYRTDEEIYDAFMEHMRFHETNEVTAVRDLMYAQESDYNEQDRFARLLQTWDRMEGDPMSFQKVGDYVEAGITAPSTWLGLVTGGAGKLGAMSSAQAAKLGTRTILSAAKKEALKGAGKAAAVEGTVGFGTGLAQEGARVETGAKEEFDLNRALLTGGAGAVTGGVLGGVAGFTQAKSAERVLGKAAIGEAEYTARKAAGKENTEKFFSSLADKTERTTARKEVLTEEIEQAREFLKKTESAKLDPLDRDAVRQGTELLNELTASERTLARLSDDTVDAISATVIRMKDKIKIKPGERVSQAIYSAIARGDIEDEFFQKTLKEFGLSEEEFASVYLADVSKAARTLGKVSATKRNLGANQNITQEEAKQKLESIVSAATDYLNSASAPISKEEVEFIADMAKKQAKQNGFFRDLDRFRLSMMTGQLATTMRNVTGGGFRVVADVLDTGLETYIRSFSGENMVNPFAVSNYLLFNQQEAALVKQLFQKRLPGEADRFYGTFMETAIASAGMKGDSLMTRTGAKVNMLNTLSDNTFKQAVFAGRLSQKIGKSMTNKNGKPMTLSDVIEEGRFNEIDHKIIKEAIDDSLDFVYQRMPTGDDAFSKAGKLLVDAHHAAPFVVSSMIPFPRFVINQLNFISQHAPVIGMAVARYQRGQGAQYSADVMAKQISGSAMLMAAYNLRASQGLDTEWYEVELDDGKVIDMRAAAGPMNAFLLGADLMYRSQVLDWNEDSNELKNWAGTAKDAFQAVGGPSFRAGTGLYTLDRVVEDMSSTEELGIRSTKTLATFVGDIFNTFTLPAATVRDMVSLSDEEERLVPDGSYTNFFDILASRATRSLPKAEFFSASEYISRTQGTGDVDVDAPRIDMITGKPLRSIDPFERQIFGFSKNAPRSALQRKLIELQMSPYELYRPNQYPIEDRELREAAGAEVANVLNRFVTSEEFREMGPKMQKVALAKRAKQVINEYREGAEEAVRERQIEDVRPGESIEADRFAFESLPARERDALREAYKEQYNREMGTDFAGALELRPAVIKRAEGKRFNEGGFVGDPLSLSETAEEEDPEAREEAGEAFIRGATELALDTAPVTGEIRSAQGAVEDFEKGDYGMAALGALGAVPGVGMVARGAKAGVKGLSKTVDELYEEFGTTVDTFEDAKKEWLKRTGKKPNTDVSERITELEEAAKKVKEGELDVEEFRKIADQYKPVKVWEDVPEMATFEDMFFALDERKRKAPFIGYNTSIEEGTRLESRLDIPAYTGSDTWVVSLKGPKDVEGGKTMYAPAVRLKNVDLGQSLANQEKALKVASGAGKGPFAVLKGDYVESTAEDSYRLAKEAINDDDWIQIGYDPTRRGYFYDRETMEPVLNADEVVQVGALVLAKNAKKGDPKDFKFNSGGLMSRK